MVSIIVNNYNCGQFLADAIDSALNQIDCEVQVIVVDDGSIDQSRDIIGCYDDRITPVLKRNSGQASALNAGFARSHGEIVIFLDVDDVLLPHAARSVVEAFTAVPGAAKVQYRMAIIDRNGQATNKINPPQHIPLPNGDLRHQELEYPFDLAWLPTSGNAFSAAILHTNFPIPEDSDPILADYYLVHLAALYGSVVSLDKVCAYYQVHGANHDEVSALKIDLARIRFTLFYADQTRRYLQQQPASLSLLDCPVEIMSVSWDSPNLVARPYGSHDAGPN